MGEPCASTAGQPASTSPSDACASASSRTPGTGNSQSDGSTLRLDIDGNVFEATVRTARYAILWRQRQVRDALFWSYLLPPLGWNGRRERLLLEQDSHAKADENLARQLARVEEIKTARALNQGGEHG